MSKNKCLNTLNRIIIQFIFKVRKKALTFPKFEKNIDMEFGICKFLHFYNSFVNMQMFCRIT